MPELRRLSGREVIAILEAFGFVVMSQRGSHVKMRRVLDDGTKQTLTVPFHAQLKQGMLRALYRQATQYISEVELRPYFYTD